VFRVGWALAAGLGSLSVLRAAELATTHLVPPRIAFHYPAGGRAGTRFELTVGGAWPAWPIQGQVLTPGILLEPTETEGRFQVVIAPDVPPGPVLLWFYNEQGAAAPRQFVVGTARELTENEALSAARGAAVPETPIALNGRLLAPDETDAWLLPVTRPVRLEARLRARQLDSPLIARLALLGGQTKPLLATNGTARTDPVLRAELKLPGLYTLHVSAATNAGPAAFGPAAVYRLELAAEVIAPPPTNGVVRKPLSTGILRPLVSRNVLDPPQTIRGFINPHGDVDVYGLETRALERHPLHLATGGEPPFVARLKIVAADGATVVEETGAEIDLDWVTPETGRYRLEVSAADGGGNPGCVYQLSVGARAPHFEALIATNRFRLRPGGAAAFSLRVSRPPDNESVLTLSADGLPPGVRLDAVTLMPRMSVAPGRLSAAPDAAPVITSFRLNLLPLSDVLPTDFSVTGVVQGRHAPPGALLINETADFWLTLLPPVTP
jgi:hypothetical protein